MTDRKAKCVADAGPRVSNSQTITCEKGALRFQPDGQQIDHNLDRHKLLKRWLAILDEFRNYLLVPGARSSAAIRARTSAR
jgi:hypothetical protein